MPRPMKIEILFAPSLSSKQSIMTSIENFKTSVLRIRDILRGPGVSITGMDSMRHICLYLLSRYMTRNKVRDLGVPEEFAWENLIETAQTKNGGLQKALDLLYHKEEDSLVNHFDRLFGTEKFSFDVKNPQKHKEILEILNGVKLEDIDRQMDILGWVYEQHLKTGASAGGQRDLGQYFTDRPICEYMVSLCKPGFKHTNVPESVCDPAMGTGGFLTSYIKYYAKSYPNSSVDWKIQEKEIHGCDTDPKVACIARLNMYMETGGNCPTNLRTHDSLYNDLSQSGYDIILANMPFGIDGLKHAECCERVKSLKIRGTKSEPLFLQLMMTSLNQNGRCAVIVPETTLTNTSNLHVQTREYLFDNFEVLEVLKMKGKFFMNTAIKPVILFFKKSGEKTSSVEISEIRKDSSTGEILKEVIMTLPRDKFNDKLSFDLALYENSNQINDILSSSRYRMEEFASIVTCKNGKNIPVRDRLEKGSFPYYASNGIKGYVDKHLFEGPCALLGDQGSAWDKSSQYVENNMKFYAGNHTIVMKPKNSSVDIKYIFYYLKINNLSYYNKSSSIIPELDKERFAKMLIPVPPIETQLQIVKVIDNLYETFGNSIELTSRTWSIIVDDPSGKTITPIFNVKTLIEKSNSILLGMNGSISYKITV